MTLLALYEKLQRIVEHLPAPLQAPILREILPIKTLFLQQRAPRLLLLGDRAASRAALANALCGAPVALLEEDAVQTGTWQIFSHGHGRLRLLDARRPAALPGLTRSVAKEPPDLCLFLHVEPRTAADITVDLDHAGQVLETLRAAGQPTGIPVLGVSVSSNVAGGDPEKARENLHAALSGSARQPFGNKLGGYFVLHGPAGEALRLATAIALDLPQEARVEMGRLAGIREVQRESARVVVKSLSAICGAIGTQPIPFADLPILTGLQSAMVAGIMHISGRDLNLKLGGEWIAALGANIGVALALREGARAALKFIPGWGDVVSGGIAAAGTYAIGRAATSYFIEGFTLEDARKTFWKSRKTAPLLKSAPPPAPEPPPAQPPPAGPS